LEFIKFDDNDRGSQSGFGGAHPYGPEEDFFNTKVYYCYYEPGEESTEDLGLGKKVLTKVENEYYFSFVPQNKSFRQLLNTDVIFQFPLTCHLIKS